ncbi:hypothetical protein G8C92_13805 [Paenibacillus donghaensis]|uniref:hypothetical protein n=1 Tax=Paenibacillus donghaensis TaxID=414771 RepID=UPI00188360E9|nr:hypothetical protein [Paenibacillus donghaensis]MBE9915104.1 hypothetical protein [Paenibacillus donghaensis]
MKNNKRILSLLLAFVVACCNVPVLHAAESALPEPFAAGDIGKMGLAGAASYDSATGRYIVQGSGSDIWGKADAFHFVYQPWTGDGEIVAHVASVEKADNWTKAGIMIREDLTGPSPYAMMAATPSYGMIYQERLQADAESSQTKGTNAPAPYWVKLVREDNVITAYDSNDGTNWKLVKEQEMDLPETVYFGLAVTSHNNGKLATAEFDQVTVGNPKPLEKVVVKDVSMSEKSGLYMLQKDSAPVPSVSVTLKNKHSYDVTGQVKIWIMARGTESVWDSAVPFEATVNETKHLSIPTTALTQGDYYVLKVQVIDQDGTIADQREFGFGVLHSPHEGIREQSPFGLALRSEGDQEMEKEIAEKIGVKWQRGISAVSPEIVNPKPGVFWGEDEINKARQEVLDWQKHGVSLMGGINYNMPWNVMPGPNGEQLASYQNRPKDMAAHVEMVYHSIAPLQDLVKYWEIWNEPWVHGWTWKTGDAQDYRDMTKMIWDRIKPELPDVMLIGGGSTSYNRDIVYAKGSQDTAYVDGTTNHGYGVPDPAQLAFLKLQQYMDAHWSKSQGQGGMWNTEVGTAEIYNFPDLPDAEKKYGVARTVAPIYLLNMLSAGQMPVHTFWFSLSYDKGYSGDAFNIYDANSRTPKPAVVAYSTMTHFLEDSKLLEDIYPKEKAAWGFLFKREDGNASAALYADQDYQGTVTLNGAKGIQVYDYLGRTVSDGSQDTLSVPLNPWETNYFVSDLSPEALKAKLSAARFDFEKPAIVSPLSLLEPVKGAGTKIEVQVENPTANVLKGKLQIQAPEGWKLARDFAMIDDLAPGEKRIFAFPATKTAPNDINRYPVRYTLDVYGKGHQVLRSMQGQQTIQVAYAPKKTISIDGDLSDWQDVIPVTMVSNGSKDYLEAIMDPSRAKDILDHPDSFENVIYKARTAWDDNYFYFEAEVPDQVQFSNKPFDQDPYAFPFNADSVQLGFDTMKVNPDDLLYGDPYYEKAAVDVMDYLFVGTLAKGGIPELHRQMAPGTNKQTYYPTNADLNPRLGPMDVGPDGGKEGKMKVVRDDANKLTVYEIAVSWAAVPDLKQKLAKLDPHQVYEGHFSFAINDAGTDGKGMSTWNKETGQVQSGAYSFAPFWGTGQKDRGGSLVPRWGFKNEPASRMNGNS